MRSTLCLSTFALLVYTLTAHSQDEWQRSFGGSSQDEGMSAIATPDGGSLIVGSTRSYKGNPKAQTSGYAAKLNAGGDVEWERAFGAHLMTDPRAVYAVSDGYIVLGSVRQIDSGHNDPWIAKLDLGGTLVWEKVHYAGGDEPIYRAAQTADSGYILMGHGPNGSLLVKLTASGNLEWRREYRGMLIPRGLAQTSDGGFVVVGIATAPPAIGGDVALLRVSATGDSLWSRLFGTAASEDGHAVRQTQDGGFVAVGTTNANNDRDLYIIRTDSNGIYRSSRVYEEPGEENRILDMIPYQDGFLGVGGTDISATRSRVQLTRIGEDGVPVWSRRYGREAADNYRSAYALQETPTGIIIAGSNGYGDRADMLLMKIGGDLSAVGSAVDYSSPMNLR